jgi:hypothetical protein
MRGAGAGREKALRDAPSAHRANVGGSYPVHLVHARDLDPRDAQLAADRCDRIIQECRGERGSVGPLRGGCLSHLVRALERVGVGTPGHVGDVARGPDSSATSRVGT